MSAKCTGYKCEIARYWTNNPTIATRMVFSAIPLTEEHLRSAQDELDRNMISIPDAQLVEERKTLVWLQEEFERRNSAIEPNATTKAEEERA